MSRKNQTHNRIAINPAQVIARRLNEMYNGKYATCAAVVGITPEQFSKALHGNAGHIQSDAAGRLIVNGTKHIELMRELESGPVAIVPTNGHTVTETASETVLARPAPTMIVKIDELPLPEFKFAFTEEAVNIIEVNPKVEPVPTKHCRACNQDKPLDEFGSHLYTPDHKQTFCHTCKSAMSVRAWETRRANASAKQEAEAQKNLNELAFSAPHDPEPEKLEETKPETDPESSTGTKFNRPMEISDVLNDPFVEKIGRKVTVSILALLAEQLAFAALEAMKDLDDKSEE